MASTRISCFSLATLAVLAAPLAIKVAATHPAERAIERRLTDFCRLASDADVVEGLCDTVRTVAMPFRA
jgi:hypothetical protein